MRIVSSPGIRVESFHFLSKWEKQGHHINVQLLSVINILLSICSWLLLILKHLLILQCVWVSLQFPSVVKFSLMKPDATCLENLFASSLLVFYTLFIITCQQQDEKSNSQNGLTKKIQRQVKKLCFMLESNCEKKSSARWMKSIPCQAAVHYSCHVHMKKDLSVHLGDRKFLHIQCFSKPINTVIMLIFGINHTHYQTVQIISQLPV